MTDHDEDTTERDDAKARPDTAANDPRATEHPTGEKQAAENVENEPVA